MILLNIPTLCRVTLSSSLPSKHLLKHLLTSKHVPEPHPRGSRSVHTVLGFLARLQPRRRGTWHHSCCYDRWRRWAAHFGHLWAIWVSLGLIFHLALFWTTFGYFAPKICIWDTCTCKYKYFAIHSFGDVSWCHKFCVFFIIFLIMTLPEYKSEIIQK